MEVLDKLDSKAFKAASIPAAVAVIVLLTWTSVTRPHSIFEEHDGASNTMKPRDTSLAWFIVGIFALAVLISVYMGVNMLVTGQHFHPDMKIAASVFVTVFTVIVVSLAFAKPEKLKTNESASSAEDKLDWFFVMLIAVPASILAAGVTQSSLGSNAETAYYDMLEASGVKFGSK